MSEFQNILSFDTALQGCAVAAVSDGGVQHAILRDEPHGQAEHLMPMIEAVLAQVGTAYADLDAVVTTIGPGAFTGLRIGLSTAKALGLSLDIPVFGISSLQALALQYGGACSVLIESKRADLYVQSFDEAGMPVDAPHTELPAEIEEMGQVFIGDGVERFKETQSAARVDLGYRFIDAALLARRFQERGDLFISDIEPLYLRGADVSLPKSPPRKLSESVA